MLALAGLSGATRAQDPPPAASASGNAGSPAAPAPAYATQWPPAATLHYGLRSGLFSGRGSLRWQPDALAGYTLSLEGSVLGLKALSQGSRGALGAQGLAPEHFVDQRRGRPAWHVHFDEPAGQVRFSVGVPAQAWRARTQDRLSWMLQLSSVAAANPALMRPGVAAVELFVVGARGKAETWTFEVVSQDDIRVPAGPVAAAVHLRRLSGPGEHTQVDVWLDPARHHLPVRMRLSEADGDKAFELQLEAYGSR